MASPYRRLIFVMIDGATYDVLRELMAAGDLPALAALAEAGGGLKKAVTCFPSTTGPAYIPYFMGLFPGTANVPGYRWLSRAGYNDEGSRWTRPGLASYSGREAMSFDVDLPPTGPTWFDYFGSAPQHPQPADQGLRPGGQPHAPDQAPRLRDRPLPAPVAPRRPAWRRDALVRAVKAGARVHRLRLQRRRRPLPRTPLRRAQGHRVLPHHRPRHRPSSRRA